MLYPYLSFLNNCKKLFFFSPEKMILIKVAIGTRNWGDLLNYPLVEKMAQKDLVIPYPIIKLGKKPLFINNYPIYSVIGSILQKSSKIDNIIIWGSGFISDENRVTKEPKQICAVRGPLTRENIIKSGFDCPNIFGDPALLYPCFYNPSFKKIYKLGIIPHIVNKNHPSLNHLKKDPNVLIIDIKGGINDVINKIKMCEKIASSSLHGLIAADAYEIPSLWIKFPYDTRSDFKYYDYFLSVGRDEEQPIFLKSGTEIESLIENFSDYSIKIDLNKLIEACPFKSPNLKLKI